MSEGPRISINKLGEYMTATPARRRQIVRDQKNPPAFKAARYKPARETIVSYLEDGMADDGSPLARAAELRADMPPPRWADWTRPAGCARRSNNC